jgi:hypothetical protein
LKSELLCQAFRNPQSTLALKLPEWDLLIRQARCVNVLARLGLLLEESNILTQVPDQPLAHIKSAHTYSERFTFSLNWEVTCIKKVLADINVPLILMKGSAYIAAGNKAAIGRCFSDVDILVKEDQLQNVEIALIKAGWMTHTLDPYDQRYYRQWMHEIPPLRHYKRHTSIDVHHNILPKTSRLCPDPDKLLSKIVNTGDKNVWVLAPEDRVLHSAAHLFHEGEFSYGFRDLSDLDLLLKEYSRQSDFWQTLIERASELNQQIPLYYALRYTHLILRTPIPDSVLAVSEKISTSRSKQKLMDTLFLRALMPDHESCNDRWTGLARWLLFIRSHWLKMPFYLLAMHLTRKAYKRVIRKDHH